MNPMVSIKLQQQRLLMRLLDQAQSTDFGRDRGFQELRSYEQFAERVPVQTYDDLRSGIEALKAGRENLFWPGPVTDFAVSAGTTGTGKHLPLTRHRLQSDKRFMRKVVKSYIRQRPNILKLLGRHLSMPGSVEQKGDLRIGEISGFTALNAPAWLRWLQIADPRQLTALSFQQKFELLTQKAIQADLKVITAVPSWILTLFQEVLQRTSASTIAGVWPNLTLLVCGGVKLSNYQPHLEKLADGITPDFVETYGASEGYIGFSDKLSKQDLALVTDNGIFFECIPHPRPGPNASAPVPLWRVEKGIPYGLVLTTNAGLWRYTLNDIIEFTSIDPPRFIVKGRVNDMLDDYGEALYIYEAEQALSATAHDFELKVNNFAIAPVLQDESSVPHHRWFIHFQAPPPSSRLASIAAQIDKQLCGINRHYAIRRESNALGQPKIIPVSQTEINRWMRKTGRAKAQSKLPRILPQNTDLRTP